MKKTLLIAILFITSFGMASAQVDWKLRTEKDGIKVYTAQVTDSKVKSIKVEGEFNATPSQFVALIMDVNTCADWLYHVKTSALIKQVSPSELYYYSEVNLPWPAANRDFVGHLTVSQNPETKVVTIYGPVAKGMVPEKKGVVRITESTGKWTITPIGNDQVKVEYCLHTDPAGSLPSWLVNMFATEGPLKIFENIRVQLQKPAYKNSVYALAAE
jgi:hypothetical protein